MKKSKRQSLIYITILLWLVFGITGLIKHVEYTGMSVYFLSLTGFIGSYIWGESIRKSKSTHIFKFGKTSTREMMIYIVLLLWTIIGMFALFFNADLTAVSAYFTSLTPFVSAYILGSSYRKTKGVSGVIGEPGLS